MGQGSVGIMLLNMGGPDSLSAVKPFLYNLFSDREIIRLGPEFMQKPIAWFIANTRAGKASKNYALIGGKSPILEITTLQANALKQKSGLKTYIGMRYWNPYIADSLDKAKADGIDRIIGLSLYPQYSKATSGSSITMFEAQARKRSMEFKIAPSWHKNGLYISALADTIKTGLSAFHQGDEVHVLFSAHSLPKKFVDEGDPYVNETMATINSVCERIRMKWTLSFQSKSGPVEWVGPSTEDAIKQLAEEGVKNVLAVPISFVSDHIETLYEIDILYKHMAMELGMRFERAESLNVHPLFISSLSEIALNCAKEAGWL